MTLRSFSQILAIIFMFLISACATNSITNTKRIEMAQATQRMGEEHYRSGNYTAALKSLLEAEKALSGNPYLHNSLALVYIVKERPGLAENHFKRALQLKPDYAQAQNNLGGVYMKQRKWDIAIQTFKKVASNLLYATPEMPISNIGWAYLQQNMFKQARSYFDKALDIRPDFINAVHGRASIYMKQQNHYKALEFIQTALKKDPGAPILHADLAKTYQALGKNQRAKNAWNVVLKSVPERSILAKEARKHLSGQN